MIINHLMYVILHIWIFCDNFQNIV